MPARPPRPGFGPIHHGNDIAGSLRVPAWCNGVTTIKPSQGRLPAYNPTATAERGLLSSLMSAQGVLARTVADVRLATRAMAARDPRDPWWLPVPFDGPPLEPPLRVAVTTNPHGYPIDPRITALVERAAAHLADAGYAVEEVEPPPITDPARGWMSTGITEIKLTLDALGPRPTAAPSWAPSSTPTTPWASWSTWSTTAPGSPTGPA